MKLTKIIFSILMVMMILIGSVVPAFAANQVVCDNTGCYQITRISNQSANGTGNVGSCLCPIFLLALAAGSIFFGIVLFLADYAVDDKKNGVIFIIFGILFLTLYFIYF